MLKLNYPIAMQNNYHIQLLGPKEEVKQECFIHNVVCKGFWNAGSFTSMSFGSGTGTPADTDTSLYRLLWTLYGSRKSIQKELPTMSIHMYYEVPADASYVGDITELGIGNNDALITHALIKDAEGNPMTIHKTDVDKLLIDVDFFCSYDVSSNIEIPPIDYIDLFRAIDQRSRGNIDFSAENIINIHYVELTTCRKGANRPSYIRNDAYYTGYGSPERSEYTRYGAQLGDVSFDRDAHKCILTTKRVVQKLPVTDNIFFNGLALLGWGIHRLPNTEIFPNYTIENIPVGIGDGETVEFKCPIEYFIKDTDIITVNNVVLTRGVDYTIDNENNNNWLVELSPCNEAILSGGISGDMWNSVQPFTRPLSVTARSGGSNYAVEVSPQGIIGFDAANPLLLDMQEEVICNAIRLGLPWATGTYKLYYSTDGNEYTEVLTINKPNTSAAVSQTFDQIRARYWKITTTTNCYGYSNFNNNKEYFGFLGYVGDPNIVFSTPPEENAEIKLSVGMDRPFKNSNWVIDVSAEFSLT